MLSFHQFFAKKWLDGSGEICTFIFFVFQKGATFAPIQRIKTNSTNMIHLLFLTLSLSSHLGAPTGACLAKKEASPFHKEMAYGHCAALADTTWTELINGKDFTGWQANEHKATWTTVGGLFQTQGERSHLFYVGEHLKDGFKNFEIEVQVKAFKLANSGIYFHTQYQESGWPSKGIEIQVNNTHIGEGDYIELKKMASLYGTRNVYKSFGKDEEWMTVKAKVESDRVQIWVNGTKTVDYVPPVGSNRLGNGTFALQGHDPHSKVQYRSFKVRRLPDDARSNKTPFNLGNWADSLQRYQGQQFGFIDLNPKGNLSANALADYTYATGINFALLKTPNKANKWSDAAGLPLFTGIKVTAKDNANTKNAPVDYILGESTNDKTAQKLLMTYKISVWSDKGHSLAGKKAAMLLDLAKQRNIAIEIDNDAKTPSIAVLKMAKAKGCKFTFTGLVPNNLPQKSLYIFEAIREAKLDYKDLYIPNW